MLRWVVLAVVLAGLVGCTGSNKIQGNETGGIVPKIVSSDADAAAAAADYCKQYGRAPRITATRAEAGGTTVFVCLAPGKTSPFER
jgi:hypothetical protein